MGTQGTAQSLGGTLVLDAGALIAFERGNEDLAVMIEQLHEFDGETIVPASALAQVWRGGPRSARLAQLIDGSDIDALDEERAKEVGVRLGTRGGSDVADGHVVCCAIEHRVPVATSDRDDLQALTEPGESLRTIPV